MAEGAHEQDLVEEGKVKYLGLANCTADELRRAHAVHPISAIELEWSLCARHNEVTCAAESPMHHQALGNSWLW